MVEIIEQGVWMPYNKNPTKIAKCPVCNSNMELMKSSFKTGSTWHCTNPECEYS